MALLTGRNLTAVRAAIDLSLTAEDVPDGMINLPIFQGVAESQILARVPDAATRTGTDLQHIQNAAVYLTAALLVPSLPLLTQEKFDTDYQYTKVPIDRAVLVANLRALAESELDAVVDPTDTISQRPTMFALGHGYRGR